MEKKTMIWVWFSSKTTWCSFKIRQSSKKQCVIVISVEKSSPNRHQYLSFTTSLQCNALSLHSAWFSLYRLKIGVIQRWLATAGSLCGRFRGYICLSLKKKKTKLFHTEPQQYQTNAQDLKWGVKSGERKSSPVNILNGACLFFLFKMIIWSSFLSWRGVRGHREHFWHLWREDDRWYNVEKMLLRNTSRQWVTCRLFVSIFLIYYTLVF